MSQYAARAIRYEAGLDLRGQFDAYSSQYAARAIRYEGGAISVQYQVVKGRNTLRVQLDMK